MKIETERERGNIDGSTDIVNDGEFMAYAEARYGPWGVEYHRESKGGDYTLGRPERVIIKGPLIGVPELMPEKESVIEEVTVGTWDKITEIIDTWDYVEAADEKVFEP